MKVALYDLQGMKKGDVELPAVFASEVREDLVLKCVEAERFGQPYGTDPRAGRRHVASGIISHKRHDWKGQYGKGISRVPRKILWRRGTQFNWVGAESSGTRGGRRPHAPKAITVRDKKINDKEYQKALASALAATTHKKYIEARYERMNEMPIALPLVISLPMHVKAKQMMSLFEKFKLSGLAVKEKQVRAGKGKSRARKYKSNAGALVVIGAKEKLSVTGMDVRNVKELSISDFYPLGRIAVFSEHALEELKQ
ncbi:MAG TPA: 50S ribosomal protein L4 [Candidatus Nanoarchaeia archaeon]|nr:ribosomal protein L4 [uncultured archaeon]HLC54832.1 50S ribosomal protein L4 [Candidatus Nanoarchaeia archaeon]